METTKSNESRRPFCTVERCRLNMNKRCTVREVTCIEDFEFNEAAECDRYTPRLSKQTCISLNEEEIETLLTLLTPSSDDNGEGEALYDKIYRYAKTNPVATHMYFVNVYDRRQSYGGPEEGGWYYHTVLCEYSIGYDCMDWNQPSVTDYTPAVDRFIEELFEFEDEVVPEKAEIIDALSKRGYYEFNSLDQYGEGRIIAIERQPGAQHNIERQHYE